MPVFLFHFNLIQFTPSFRQNFKERLLPYNTSPRPEISVEWFSFRNQGRRATRLLKMSDRTVECPSFWRRWENWLRDTYRKRGRAFPVDCSVENTLHVHAAVTKLEQQLGKGRYGLGTFLDIERAYFTPPPPEFMSEGFLDVVLHKSSHEELGPDETPGLLVAKWHFVGRMSFLIFYWPKEEYLYIFYFHWLWGLCILTIIL